MTRYIAFLRAINVGGHTVRMDHLRKLFTEMGFSDVETFIASGNVIFTAPSENTADLERQIETHLRSALGYEVATFIRSGDELEEVARYRPFPDEELTREGTSLYISFLQDEPSKEAEKELQTFRTDTDEFHVRGREVYWLCRTRISDSAFSGALLEKKMRMPATMRNSTTVKKIAEKYPPRASE